MHLLALALLGCTAAPAPSVDDTSPAAAEGLDLGDTPVKNVVVVQVDTLRADAHPLWGSAHDTFPLLGRRDGWVAVERAVSTASWTAPASASLLTGLDLPRHGVRFVDTEDGSARLPASTATFAEHLGAQGFETALITGSQVLLAEQFGLDRGFEYIRHVGAEPANASALMDEVAAWLAGRAADEPFLLFLQPMDPHTPYRPAPEDLGTWSDAADPPFDVQAETQVQEEQIWRAVHEAPTAAESDAARAEVRAIYDEQVLGIDRALDKLFRLLESAGHLDDTLVVIVADHGESFFDGAPEMLGHGFTVRAELVHVPLLFWTPTGAPTRVAPCVASNADVLPTALDYLGVPAVPDTDGRSLRDACRPWAFSGTYEYQDSVESLTWLGASSTDAQVVVDCLTGETTAFDLATDPTASAALPVASVPAAADLRDALDAYRADVLQALPALSCPM